MHGGLCGAGGGCGIVKQKFFSYNCKFAAQMGMPLAAVFPPCHRCLPIVLLLYVMIALSSVGQGAVLTELRLVQKRKSFTYRATIE